MGISSNPLQDLYLLVQANHGLIYLDTPEEDRAKTLLKHLADQLNIPYFSWTSTKGLKRSGLNDSIYGSTHPTQALEHIEQSTLSAIYHFIGLEGYLEDKIVIQRLKDVGGLFSNIKGSIILTGADLSLPSSLSTLCTNFKLPLPALEDYKNLVLHVLRDMKTRVNVSVHLTPEQGLQLLNSLKGLTLVEAEKVLTKVILEDGVLTADDIQKILSSKKDIVARDGLLEYYPVEESLADIADLAGLKSWLAKRKQMVTNPGKAKEFGLSFPKGILLLGVQGCGKSLCAKAVSMEWGLPLLKFDPSTLYNKYIGETEKNFKKATLSAEKMAPVILWIDEIEKAFSSSSGEEDGGVSTRILGNFLTWMQDRKADIFIIATANNIEKLPAEFLRKGRFDEIFFVDLPNAEARKAVFEIHLKKRKRNPQAFDLDSLVTAAEGFSPAEIEQAIVSGLYSAFSHNRELTQEALLQEITETRPISITMKEKIEALRDWAKERTVRAQ